MIESIEKYCTEITKEFDLISLDRKLLLEKISEYIRRRRTENKPIQLIYICTHNSRRSHFGQIWSAVAAHYYGIGNVSTYSGGTEATAFHPNAIRAIEKIGFQVKPISSGTNPTYQLSFDAKAEPIVCFSKVYDHPQNPSQSFAAIMTCGDAEENCPFIPGVELRIGTTYSDPKAFDHTAQQDEKYDERCRQIARETFYVFSRV
ncbi:MAG: protein-tyrosine-phosphatase [Flavobacteriales bacterium]|nr:protein-tyrosine-phosphatase [Flavobacteriales bacterium]